MGQVRILIVDDEKPILFAIREFFDARAYSVDCAAELEEAEAMILHRRYDAIIADLRLSASHGEEGLQLVRFVRARWPRTALILLTAYGSSRIEREACKIGVAAMLHKPTPLTELGRIVEEVVRSNKERAL